MEPGPGTTAWLPSPAPWALVGCVVWAGDPLWAHNVHWVPTHGLDTVGVGRSGAGQPPEGTFLLPSRTQSTGQGSWQGGQAARQADGSQSLPKGTGCIHNRVGSLEAVEVAGKAIGGSLVDTMTAEDQ